MTNNAILTLTSVVRKDSFVSLVTRMHACRLNSQYKSIWCKLLLDLLAFINSLAWENSRYLATLPTTALVSPPNDVWETSAEIPYWWRVTTQIWEVTRHQYGISAFVSQTSFGGETSGSVAKCRLSSQANNSQVRWNVCAIVNAHAYRSHTWLWKRIIRL